MLSTGVGTPAAPYSGRPALHSETLHTRWQLLGIAAAGDVVRWLRPRVMVGYDGAYQGGGLSAGIRAHNVHTRRVGVLMVTFTGRPLVQVSDIGLTPACHRDVQHCAAGTFSRHRVRGVGCCALAGVHGDGIAVSDVLAQVLAAEGVGFPSYRGDIAIRRLAMERRKFDRQFQEGAVRIVRETGKPIAQVARDSGLHQGTLGKWVNIDRRARGGEGPLSESEREELKRLRAENAELAMERDVLKRSVALWVKEAMRR